MACWETETIWLPDSIMHYARMALKKTALMTDNTVAFYLKRSDMLQSLSPVIRVSKVYNGMVESSVYNGLCWNETIFTLRNEHLVPSSTQMWVIDINVENTIRQKLKMRPYNSVQMSSLWIRPYVLSVISVYKDINVHLLIPRLQTSSSTSDGSQISLKCTTFVTTGWLVCSDQQTT